MSSQPSMIAPRQVATGQPNAPAAAPPVVSLEVPTSTPVWFERAGLYPAKVVASAELAHRHDREAT